MIGKKIATVHLQYIFGSNLRKGKTDLEFYYHVMLSPSDTAALPLAPEVAKKCLSLLFSSGGARL